MLIGVSPVLVVPSIFYGNQNKCRVAWQNATIAIHTRNYGGLNQGKNHKAGKRWTMSGHAVEAELTGHADGVDMHKEEEASMVTSG